MKIAMIIGAVAMLSSGCASFTGNTSQPVVVKTTCGDKPVQGARCRIINANGAWIVDSTPGSVMVRKASSDMAIDCKMPQAQAVPGLYESHAGPGAWGNLLIGGILGFGVDTYRDAAWRYDPEVTIDMCRDIPDHMSKALQSSTVVPAISNSMNGMQSVIKGEQKYAISAEAVARQQQCTATPHAVLNARGPATEVYTVACNNGDALMLKCTYGTCKAI